jgi:DNA-binding NtrC family response regulator
MAYGFIKESGGHIHIDSAPGAGTTIRILLPRSAEAEFPTSAPPTSNTKNGEKIVLIVEDKSDLRNMIGMMLESLGYRVWKAANSQEALIILKGSESIDALFTDINLPGGINGFELAKQAQSMRPDLTVLLASGYDDWESSRDTTAEAQAFSFLNKPYTVQEVDAMIKKLLSKKEGELSEA